MYSTHLATQTNGVSDWNSLAHVQTGSGSVLSGTPLTFPSRHNQIVDSCSPVVSLRVTFFVFVRAFGGSDIHGYGVGLINHDA